MKKLVLTLLLLVCILCILLIAKPGSSAKSNNFLLLNPSSLLVHNLNTTEDFATIQEAINDQNTSNGHVIRVDAGIFFEHVTITKSISLIGEGKESTIVDGNGTGTVVQISVSNVSLINFTARHAGRIWGPPPGFGYPDTCVIGKNVRDVLIENSTFDDAAVCVAFTDSSSLVNVSNNVVSNATYIGVLGYASNNLTISHNLVFDYGYEGIHLDGGSYYCRITNNTVKNGMDGISLEKSATAGNLIDDNYLLDNIGGIGFYASGVNVFRNNNMTHNQYNILILGHDLNSFMQDIDDSNVVNNKTVYYLTTLTDAVIEPSTYPNLGFLAIVNCTNTTAKDFNITRNRDGILLAYSTNCTLANITLSENHGPLMWGSLTLYSSNNNTIINDQISDNSYAVCLNHSDGNIFYHNSFLNNSEQVVSNFYSPFHGNTSGYISVNAWDNGYPCGGNYWEDYVGVDVKKGASQDLPGSDGMGDTSYNVDVYNQDHYPLMNPYGTPPAQTFNLAIITKAEGTTNPTPGTYNYTLSSIVHVTANPVIGFSFAHWLLDGEEKTENPITITMDADHTLEAFFVDDIPPEIGSLQQNPLKDIQPHQNVTVTVNVADLGTGVHNVTLWYSIDNGTTWVPLNMAEISVDIYQTIIPGQENSMWVTYKIVAYDNAGQQAVDDNSGYYYKYPVVPEIPAESIVAIFFVTSLIAVIATKRKGIQTKLKRA